MHRSVVVVVGGATPYRIQHGNSNSHGNFGVSPKAKPADCIISRPGTFIVVVVVVAATQVRPIFRQERKCITVPCNGILCASHRRKVPTLRNENRVRATARIKGVFSRKCTAKRSVAVTVIFENVGNVNFILVRHTHRGIIYVTLARLRFRYFDIIPDGRD